MHHAFIDIAVGILPEGTPRALFRHMVRMSGIEHLLLQSTLVPK
jgi:hypothetical protein